MVLPCPFVVFLTAQKKWFAAENSNICSVLAKKKDFAFFLLRFLIFCSAVLKSKKFYHTIRSFSTENVNKINVNLFLKVENIYMDQIRTILFDYLPVLSSSFNITKFFNLFL